MGADGGTIVKKNNQKEAIKEYKHSSSQLVELSSNDTYMCPLSLEVLASPIVGDYLGTFYNKDAVLQLVLDKMQGTRTEKYTHLTSLKDVVDINAVWNEEKTRIVCPIMNKEFQPGSVGNEFAYFVPCGCMCQAKVIKELDRKLCPVCNESIQPRDVIAVFPSQEEEVKLEERMAELSAANLTHSLKPKKSERKTKKRKGEGRMPGMKKAKI
ncbi:hypothetical protein BABINDRAFT_164454 [Babjeviella inositovora NRRL Y-12698]|uniref:Replication termination factor 2 n=1 Tax=Babjeviella inositovora NRRL Y-12698 TaxID=984486 RepID=A0A1E3QYS4_9ASCO|nr:uncharacterized protein BABINDRAFT_164454 [Babjeviella inositovora NRRL Y-12698]ODQ82704.1 hypothetical protein BABINDRAFT_164454 [Babjeviella inositovora NRRL Y-12698]